METNNPAPLPEGQKNDCEAYISRRVSFRPSLTSSQRIMLELEIERAWVTSRIAAQDLISDLTRRLAEAEGERDKEAGKVDTLRELCSKQRHRAEAAEATCRVQGEQVSTLSQWYESEKARVRELEAESILEREAVLVLAERIADLEAQLSGVGVRQYREAVERLHKAEARMALLKDDNEQHEQERIEDAGKICGLETFKARVLAWARGRCEFCGNISTQACQTCCNYAPDAAGTDNWTLPKKWEVAK